MTSSRFGYITRFTYISATKQTIKVLVYMMTKIAIKSDSATPFGGIFYTMDEFSRLGMSTLIDKSLGLRSSYAGYQYSEIISSLFWIYYCGGDHIEDIGQHLGGHLELRSDTEIPSPDTLLRGIQRIIGIRYLLYFRTWIKVCLQYGGMPEQSDAGYASANRAAQEGAAL